MLLSKNDSTSAYPKSLQSKDLNARAIKDLIVDQATIKQEMVGVPIVLSFDSDWTCRRVAYHIWLNILRFLKEDSVHVREAIAAIASGNLSAQFKLSNALLLSCLDRAGFDSHPGESLELMDADNTALKDAFLRHLSESDYFKGDGSVTEIQRKTLVLTWINGTKMGSNNRSLIRSASTKKSQRVVDSDDEEGEAEGGDEDWLLALFNSLCNGSSQNKFCKFHTYM